MWRWPRAQPALPHSVKTYQVFGQLGDHSKGGELAAMALGVSRESFHRLAAFGLPVPSANLPD